MFEQTNSSLFFSSHPHEYDEVKHFLTSLPEISFSTLQKEQLFHAFVSRLFLRVGVRWRARVRAGPVVLKKEKTKKCFELQTKSWPDNHDGLVACYGIYRSGAFAS